MVRISRRFEDTPIRGYVLDVGPTFFLLALVSDRLWFDGFECFRIADLKMVQSDPYTRFAEDALKKRKERRPKNTGVSVRNIASLLASANRAFPLITIHREEVDSEVCYIGRVAKITRGELVLLEIRPDASWEDRPQTYRLSDITSVNFGGDYEDALAIVGGNPTVSRAPRARVPRIAKR